MDNQNPLILVTATVGVLLLVLWLVRWWRDEHRLDHRIRCLRSRREVRAGSWFSKGAGLALAAWGTATIAG